jgi:hypothetical protein
MAETPKKLRQRDLLILLDDVARNANATVEDETAPPPPEPAVAKLRRLDTYRLTTTEPPPLDTDTTRWACARSWVARA